MTPYEIRSTRLLEQCVVTLLVTVTLATFLFRLEDVDLGAGARGGGFLLDGYGYGEILEDVLGIKKLGVDVFGSKEVATDNEDFGGDVTAVF